MQLLQCHRDKHEKDTDEIIKDATVVAEKVGLEEDHINDALLATTVRLHEQKDVNNKQYWLKLCDFSLKSTSDIFNIELGCSVIKPKAGKFSSEKLCFRAEISESK